MSKNLVIVESPAKAKTIEKFLGKDYHVMSCFGHIRDLPKRHLCIDIEHGFHPEYEIQADKKTLIAQLSKAGVSIDRLACIMNSEVESDVADATDWDMHQDIVFDHVSFSYEAGGQKILDDVSFTIPKGTTFGILGGTGSGKSTLVSLLDRLYDRTDGEGESLVGGREIRKIRHPFDRGVAARKGIEY